MHHLTDLFHLKSNDDNERSSLCLARYRAQHMARSTVIVQCPKTPVIDVSQPSLRVEDTPLITGSIHFINLFRNEESHITDEKQKDKKIVLDI